MGAARPASRHSLRDALKGFGVLALSNVLGQFVGLLALAFVSRRIGVASLGSYNFAATLAAFLGIIGNGVGYVGWRDASPTDAGRSRVLSETLTLQALVGIICYVVLVTLLSPLAPSGQERALMPIVGINLLVAAATLDWILFLVQRRALVAGARLFGQLCYAALVPVLVTSTSGPQPYAWLNVLGVGITAGLIAVVVVRSGLVRYRWPSLSKLALRARRSATLTYSLAMIQIYNVSDVLLLGYLAGSHSVGLYTAANRLPASIVTFANLWLQAFFPQAAARLQDDPAAFRRDLAATLSGAIILAVVIAGGAAVIAPQLMRALFGGAFRGSATPFVVLAAAMSLVLIEAVLSNVLIAGGKDRTYAAVVTVAAGVNVALNFVLIPSMHATGSALATLVTESLLVGMTLTLGIAGLGAPTMAWGRIARGVASAAAMCAAMWLVVGVASVWLSILTGVCVLTCMVLLTQPFDPRLWSGRSENSGLPRG